MCQASAEALYKTLERDRGPDPGMLMRLGWIAIMLRLSETVLGEANERTLAEVTTFVLDITQTELVRRSEQ